MFWKTPIFRNFQYFLGKINTKDIAFPYTLDLRADAGIYIFLQHHICREISRAFMITCRVRKATLYIPFGPDECADKLYDFIGQIYAHISIAGRGNRSRVYSCGHIFLPIGMFVPPEDARSGSGRLLLDGKEKVITFSESIMSDYPYLTPNKPRRETESGRIHKEVRMFDMDPSSAETASSPEEPVNYIKCAYKCFSINQQVIDIVVDENGETTIRYSGVPAVRFAKYRDSNERICRSVQALGVACQQKWLACQQYLTPLSNTNDYVLKILSSPSQMITNYWKKCVAKEIRIRRRIKNFRHIHLVAILRACSPYRMKRMLKCGKTNFFQEDRSWNHEKCTQVVDSENILSGLCQEYRVVPSYCKTTKQTYMRQIHASQYGLICPVFTPDGANIGMIRHLCEKVRVSVELDPRMVARVRRYLEKRLVRRIVSDQNGSSFVKVESIRPKISSNARRTDIARRRILLLFNNEPLGWFDGVDYAMLLRAVRTQLVERFANIGVHKDFGILFIYYGVNGHLEKKIDNVWRNVRTIWTFAEEFVPRIRHLFHPINDIQQYGAHNEAPRNSLASGMIKQAASSNDTGARIANSEWKHLLDGDAPRRDINERFGAYVNFLLIPHECTQEDSIVLSENTVRTKFLRQNEKTILVVLPSTMMLHSPTLPPGAKEYASFARLANQEKHLIMCADTGIISYKFGFPLPSNRPIIYAWTSDGVPRPLVISHTDPSGYRLRSIELIEKSMQDCNNDNTEEYVVRYKLFRTLTISVGDKLQTKHGNKGVVSQILPDNVMLKARNLNITIDAYIHPVPLIKRQQIGHFIEAMDNTVLTDEIYDPQTNISLGRMEIHRIYMFVLKQLAQDKCHLRQPGDVLPLLRQPPEGRANNGGCKLGEMETQVLLSTGATHLLKNLLAIPGHGVNLSHCRGCGDLFDFNFERIHRQMCLNNVPIRSIDKETTRYCFHLLNNLLIAFQRRRIVLSSRR